MPGCGFDAFGSAPAGLGTPVASPALALSGYQLSTTGAVSSVNVDPTTRDYTFDSYGNDEGMSDTGQRVFVLMATLADSRLANSDGFHVPQKADSSASATIAREVKRVLAPCIDDHTIELIDVSVERDETIPTNVYAIIRWRDVRTSALGTNTLRLRA